VMIRLVCDHPPDHGVLRGVSARSAQAVVA
jgi:hypothetical protein